MLCQVRAENLEMQGAPWEWLPKSREGLGRIGEKSEEVRREHETANRRICGDFCAFLDRDLSNLEE